MNVSEITIMVTSRVTTLLEACSVFVVNNTFSFLLDLNLKKITVKHFDIFVSCIELRS